LSAGNGDFAAFAGGRKRLLARNFRYLFAHILERHLNAAHELARFRNRAPFRFHDAYGRRLRRWEKSHQEKQAEQHEHSFSRVIPVLYAPSICPARLCFS